MQTVRVFTKAVTAAGTALAFFTTETTVRKFWLVAKKVGGANAGNVYIGDSTVDRTTSQQLVLAPGDYWELDTPQHSSIDLSTLYVDADNAADGVTGGYLPAF